MDENKYLIIGTYTSGKSKGLYVYNLNQNTGDSKFLHLAAGIENPSYLVAHKSKKYIYSVTENEDRPSYANAFSFDINNGKLQRLNRQLTNADAPCYIEIDKSQKYVVTANYAGSSISVFEIEIDGSLSKLKQQIKFEGKGCDPQRQEKPHIHCVKFSPENKFLFVTDLGTDNIHRFEINTKENNSLLDEKSLTFFHIPECSGPRHLMFHPSGKYLYLINELSGTVISFDYNGGDLRKLQSIDIDNSDRNEAGDIDITPDGKFLYASSRIENDGVAIYSIDAATGILNKTGYTNTGIHPRNIGITPNGKFLLVANKDSNSIEIYEISRETGLIKNINKDIQIDQPVCLIFV